MRVAPSKPTSRIVEQHFCLPVTDLELSVRFFLWLGYELNGRPPKTPELDTAFVLNPATGIRVQLLAVSVANGQDTPSPHLAFSTGGGVTWNLAEEILAWAEANGSGGSLQALGDGTSQTVKIEVDLEFLYPSWIEVTPDASPLHAVQV